MQQPQPPSRQSWTRVEKNEERHKGSFDLDEITASDVYKNREPLTNTFKRKYALCFGYLGTAYQGLQINPGAHTVEKELEKALLLSGALSESNFGYLHKISFSRAGRTDRGVHAVTQCCAMKLEFPLGVTAREAFLARLNRCLPDDIRALAATKVSKAFNSKNFCTHRRYQYLLPTYALKPVLEMNALLQAEYDLQGAVVGAAHAGGYVESSSGGELGAEALRRYHNNRHNYTEYAH
jgi:tRNA U38,U39,U40 pseudouridine synthase TruA